ncbi:MAG: hypothetical protein QM611_10245 [Microbacterium sp.]|uniref:hypothetical protein n=1 Tax=Microbacterium sp. TaxID=51671 RepID=UPI0039E5E0CB
MRKTIGCAVATATAVLALAGCAAAAPEAGESTPDAKAAAAFVACLTSAGVDATVGDAGHVLVKRESTGGTEFEIGSAEEAAEGAVTTGDGKLLFATGDDQGNFWIAVESSGYFVDDPDTQDAYAACEHQFPDFEQPESDPMSDPQMQEVQEQMTAAALEFARCARDAGFSWVSDPAPDAGGAVELPAALAEDDFRGALEECYDPEKPLGWATSGTLGFDLNAVLEEFAGGPGSGGISVVEESGGEG